MAENETQGITTGTETSEANTDGESTEGTESAEVTALKVQLAEAQTATTKAEGDKRAAEGRLRKDQDVVSQIADLRAEQVDSNRATSATLKALAAGDTESLPAQLQTIEAESAQGRNIRRFDAAWNSLLDDMDAIVADEDGGKLLDLDTAPELTSWRAKVTEAHRRGDINGISATLGELSRLTHKARSATIDKQIADARKEEQDKAKANLEKVGVHDLDAGAGAGGAGGDTSRIPISRTEQMAAGIGKLKKEGKDFAVTPTSKT